ncbi:hypothetical protein CALVIDRAFT_542285 [Calocera viscosa TUFC12733]|uniref:Uncharacterized protein n=1 Tax=Calocera viscosa (strain TUFC12733) TaxID=1330018 RepID=A0A167GUE5_CALVF|nr:hypothetical protein CALVIDRAFT_542285 [Calocera viscosa TUFC12733]
MLSGLRKRVNLVTGRTPGRCAFSLRTCPSRLKKVVPLGHKKEPAWLIHTGGALAWAEMNISTKDEEIAALRRDGFEAQERAQEERLFMVSVLVFAPLCYHLLCYTQILSRTSSYKHGYNICGKLRTLH